jgi:hypothetical protein
MTAVVLKTGIEDENSAMMKIRKRPNRRNRFGRLEVSSAGDLPCHRPVQRATGSGTTEGALGVTSVGWEGGIGRRAREMRGGGGGHHTHGMEKRGVTPCHVCGMRGQV